MEVERRLACDEALHQRMNRTAAKRHRGVQLLHEARSILRELALQPRDALGREVNLKAVLVLHAAHAHVLTAGGHVVVLALGLAFRTQVKQEAQAKAIDKRFLCVREVDEGSPAVQQAMPHRTPVGGNLPAQFAQAQLIRKASNVARRRGQIHIPLHPLRLMNPS